MTKNYFSGKELSCKHCGMLNFSDETLKKLNLAREIAGIPFTVSSACRCKAHNAAEGGKPNSAHVCEGREAMAMDIQAKDSRSRFKITKALFLAGFTRIGMSKAGNFIHADDDPNLDQEVLWYY